VVIDTATNLVSPTTIPVGVEPRGIAITPDGKTAYVVNRVSGSLSVIDTATNLVSPTTIPVGVEPLGIAITPDGKTAYVTNEGSEAVSVIGTATNTANPIPIAVGAAPRGLAIAPDQPPVAAFSPSLARPGVAAILDASASKDPDSPIASYAWSFGDGQSATLNSPKASHSFASPGTYTVSLKETDAENCSTAREEVFTGQTASGCAGGGAAQVAKTITVAYPGVSASCPKSAGRAGCKFAVQAVAKAPSRKPCGGHCKQPKAKAQSAVAKAKVRAGHSAIVSIVPKAVFNSQLAQAQSILFKETVLAKGKSKTRYVKLRVVQ
jgi:YVTN family beta-propeller protein